MAFLGEAFMIRKPGHDKEHLFVLITEPDAQNQSIMVNVTTLNDGITVRTGLDETTILNRGDHPFIQWSSIILYSDARLVRLSDLERGKNSGAIRSARTFKLW